MGEWCVKPEAGADWSQPSSTAHTDCSVLGSCLHFSHTALQNSGLRKLKLLDEFSNLNIGEARALSWTCECDAHACWCWDAVMCTLWFVPLLLWLFNGTVTSLSFMLWIEQNSFSWKCILLKTCQNFKTCSLSQNYALLPLDVKSWSVSVLYLAHKLEIIEEAFVHTIKLKLQKISHAEVSCSWKTPFMILQRLIFAVLKDTVFLFSLNRMRNAWAAGWPHASDCACWRERHLGR